MGGPHIVQVENKHSFPQYGLPPNDMPPNVAHTPDEDVNNSTPIPIVATYPSAGGQCEGSRVRLPREEGARSRHRCLFEENVGKTGKDAIYELLSERFGSCVYARGRY